VARRAREQHAAVQRLPRQDLGAKHQGSSASPGTA
jgi:hypothetical protein